MIYQCTGYLFPDGSVMVNGNRTVDNLDKWLAPDQKQRARKVTLVIDDNGETALGKVVNQ